VRRRRSPGSARAHRHAAVKTSAWPASPCLRGR
jgi:hypothetical protein